MPQVSVTVAHDLGQEEAVRRLRAEAEKLWKEHGGQIRNAQEQWDDNTLSFGFSVMGANVKGTLAAGPADARLAIQIPLTAIMFKGTIQKKAEAELNRVLAR